MLPKKRALKRSGILTVPGKRPAKTLDTLQDTSDCCLELETDLPNPPGICWTSSRSPSRLMEVYTDSVDSFNHKMIRRLVREHQLFMEVMRNHRFEVDNRMEIE